MQPYSQPECLITVFWYGITSNQRPNFWKYWNILHFSRQGERKLHCLPPWKSWDGWAVVCRSVLHKKTPIIPTPPRKQHRIPPIQTSFNDKCFKTQCSFLVLLLKLLKEEHSTAIGPELQVEPMWSWAALTSQVTLLKERLFSIFLLTWKNHTKLYATRP